MFATVLWLFCSKSFGALPLADNSSSLSLADDHDSDTVALVDTANETELSVLSQEPHVV